MSKAAIRIKKALDQQKIIDSILKAKSHKTRPFSANDPRTLSELIEFSIDGMVTHLLLKPETVVDILENAKYIDTATFQLMVGIMIFNNDSPFHSCSNNEYIKAVTKANVYLTPRQNRMMKAIMWLCRCKKMSNKSPQESIAMFFNINKSDIIISKSILLMIDDIRRTVCKNGLKVYITKLERLASELDQSKNLVFKRKRRLRY